MEKNEKIRIAAFHSTALQVHQQDGEEWLTSEDLGRALGYPKPRRGVNIIFHRNKKEFEGLTCVTNLVTQGQFRKTRLYNRQACIIMACLAKTPKAPAFRRWVSEALLQMPDHLQKFQEIKRELEQPRQAARAALPPPSPKNQFQELQREEIENFVEECMELNPGFATPSSLIARIYCWWCNKKGIPRPQSKRAMSVHLGKMGLLRARTKSERLWIGLAPRGGLIPAPSLLLPEHKAKTQTSEMLLQERVDRAVEKAVREIILPMKEELQQAQTKLRESCWNPKANQVQE